MQASLNQLQAQISAHTTHLDKLQQRVSDLEDEKAALMDEVKQNSEAQAQMALKIDDLENRSCRNNLRLVAA